ncbi:MAG: GGDEF domain-containing protein [Bacillota bacterium]
MHIRPSTNIADLQRLLSLARDLLQTADFCPALELIGPAIAELLLSDRAVLLVFMGNQEHAIAFDQFGKTHSAQTERALYQCARQATKDAQLDRIIVGPNGIHALQISDHPELPGSTVLAVPFPWTQPVGALLVGWNKKKDRQFLRRRIVTLHHIAELVGAALGNLQSRQELERQMQVQDKELADVTEGHAKEMLRRDRVEEEIRHISITDVMTGLSNRRGFFLQAEQNLKIARRQRMASAVIFADVDGLKLINDALGHDVGDQLIRDSADVLRQSFRSSDVIARLGGDEFAVFTLDAANTDAILPRIRGRIEIFNRNSSRPYQVAFSTGIVQCDPVSSLTLADYLLMADTQMYAQKKERHYGKANLASIHR